MEGGGAGVEPPIYPLYQLLYVASQSVHEIYQHNLNLQIATESFFAGMSSGEVYLSNIPKLFSVIHRGNRLNS